MPGKPGDSDTQASPILFVRSPQVGQMRDPLHAHWNLALDEQHANTSIDPDKFPLSGDAIDLAELIDFSQMNGIFQNFLEVVGLPVAIIDFNARVLASSKWQRLCMEFHRVNEGTLARCLESDISLSRQMQEGKPYAIYRCRNGLTDCASPIVIEGKHIANLFIGQFLLAPPDMDYFRQQQQAFGFEEEPYFRALAEVPIVAEEKLPAILDLLTGLAHQLAQQSLANRRVLAAYATVEQQVVERTRELGASHELLRKLSSQVPGVIYQYRLKPDGTSCFPYASDGIREIYEVTPEQVRENADAVLAIIHPDDAERVAATIRHSADTLTPWHAEYRVALPRQGLRWREGNSVPERLADGTILWHGFITDISERKEAERRLREMNENLEQRVHAEVDKNLKQEHLLIQQSRMAAMGEMIGNIAHQWRQPLNSLAILLANLKDGFEFGDVPPDEVERLLDTGNRLIQRMSTTIDDFRNFFRPNKEKTLFSLRGKLSEVLQILGASLANRSITVEEDVSSEVMALGYGNEFAQVLLNVLNNAKEAIIQAKIPRGAIRVSITREGDMAVVRVADNGGGIPAEIMPRIFEPYFTTKEKGTGIGLYMSRLILDHMGGAIEARNVDGGAEFTLKIPL